MLPNKYRTFFSRKHLRILVDDKHSKFGRIFALFIQGLIILSLIAFSVETLPDISPIHSHYLYLFEVVAIIIFTLEYLLRLYAAKKRLSYIFSFYGIVDLLAILPFYLLSGVDLRAVRLFRLFRLIRIFKLFKYSRALQRFHRAFILVKEEMLVFGGIAMIMLYLSAVGIYYCENAMQPELFKSVPHCLWWALTTLTTVGYGDMYPITIGGKVFTFFVLMVGLGIVAVPTGLIATALSQTRSAEKKRQDKNK